MTHRHLSLAFAVSCLVSLSTASCASSTPAPASQPATVVEAPAPAGGSFAINAQNSKIEWTGSKVSTHHDGAFGSFNGKIDLPGAVEQGKVSVEIDTASLTVNDPALGPMVEKLMGHLKSPDFFDVAKFAKATFVSSSVKPVGDGSYTVTGTLTIRGVAKEISFPATIKPSATGVDASATFTINRKDFGIVLVGQPNDPIKDDVQVKLTVHANRA